MCQDGVVVVENLEEVYNHTTDAVNGISFLIREGEVFELLGQRLSRAKNPNRREWQAEGNSFRKGSRFRPASS